MNRCVSSPRLDVSHALTHEHMTAKVQCSCGSVVEHYVSSAKGHEFSSQGKHILTKKKIIV